VWEFFNQILERGGTAAVLFAATFGLFTVALRELWRVNARLQQQFAAQQIAHERALKQKDGDHLERLQELTEVYAERIDELQEKRVAETQAVTTEVVRHVAHTQQSVDKITVAMETLTEVMRR